MQRVDSVTAGWGPAWDTGVRQTEAMPVPAGSSVDLRDASDLVLVEAFLAGRSEAFDVIVDLGDPHNPGAASVAVNRDGYPWLRGSLPAAAVSITR